MGDLGKKRPTRYPVQEQVEERLKRGAFAALKAVFSPGVAVADTHEFPYRAEVEVVPIEGEPGMFWMSVTLYSRGTLLLNAGPERACLVVSGDSMQAVVESVCFGVKAMKEQHLGQRKPKIG